MKYRFFCKLVFLFLLTAGFGWEAQANYLVKVELNGFLQDRKSGKKQEKRDDKKGRKNEKKPEVKEVPKSRKQERPSSVKKEEKR